MSCVTRTRRDANYIPRCSLPLQKQLGPWGSLQQENKQQSWGTGGMFLMTCICQSALSNAYYPLGSIVSRKFFLFLKSLLFFDFIQPRVY